MDRDQYSAKNPDTWHERFTKDELQWDDIKRVGKELLPIIVLVFVATLYLVGFAAFILTIPENKENFDSPQELITLFAQIITIALASAALLYNIIRSQALELIKKIYQLPDSHDLSTRFGHKIFGIPPLPKPLSRLARYPFITLRQADDLEQDHWARWHGGPATLVIYDGVAVYLERGNQFSRVLGPGLPMPVLERYETIKAVIDLRPRIQERTITTWTKDGIEVEFSVRAEIQLFSSDEAKRKSVRLTKGEKSRHLLFPFDPDTVKTVAERTAVRLDNNTREFSETNWAGAAMGTITGKIKAHLAAYSIDELFFEDENSPKFLSFEVSGELTQKIRDGLGPAATQLNSVQITQIKPSNPQVLEILKSYWQIQQKKEAIIKEGQRQAETIRAKQKVSTKIYQDFLDTLIDNLVEINHNSTGIDPDRFAESSVLLLTHVLEQSMGDPVLGPFVAKEGLKALAMLKRQLNM